MVAGLQLMAMFSQMIYIGGWEKFWRHLGEPSSGRI